MFSSVVCWCDDTRENLGSLVESQESIAMSIFYYDLAAERGGKSFVIKEVVLSGLPPQVRPSSNVFIGVIIS